jgi:hypothetical protein
MHHDDVPIAHPCDEDRDAMRVEDGGRRRWCERCERPVHDLSAMGEPAARAFLRERAGTRLCLSYFIDEDGAIVFELDPSQLAAPLVPLERLCNSAGRLASVASLAVLLTACNPSEPVERGESVEIVDAPNRVALAPYLMIPTQPVEHEPCEPAPETKTKAEAKTKKRKPDREKIKLEMIQGDMLL